MLSEQIQNRLDPKRCAGRGDTFAGVIPLAELELPAEVLDAAVGSAQYSITFGQDPQAFVYIQGWVEAELVLECQRCLNSFKQHMRSEFCLSPVQTDEEAEKLPERYEATFMESGTLSLSQLVEEELILSFPISPLHSGGCPSEDSTQN
jgi:uncharacterized protein